MRHVVQRALSAGLEKKSAIRIGSFQIYHLHTNREGDRKRDSQSQTHRTISDWPAGINRYGDHEKPKLALSTTHRLSAHIFLDIMANAAF